MATLETQILDDIIVKSRRKLLTFGGAALAGLVIGGSAEKAHATPAYSDTDILNFALNLEYLEANFYYQCAFGCTIDAPNAAATAAGALKLTITGPVGTAGGPAQGGSKVNFATNSIAGYCIETAIEEGKHVQFLQTAIGSSTYVAQPLINIGTVFQAVGSDLSPSQPTFSPYASEDDFLLGAYIFEDVGVTAYHGAASLLTSSGNLSAAAGILAVEAYHAGLIRTTITLLDPTAATLGAVADSISTLRASLSKAALLGSTTVPINDTNPDDFGTAPNFSVSLGGAASVNTTRIVDADTSNSIAFARNTTQVLNIVTAGNAVNTAGTAAVSPAMGGFFPNGMNGLFK